MNHKAAQELLDMVMIDDLVERRAALDTWSRRWVAQLHVEMPYDGLRTPVALSAARALLMRKIFKAIMDDSVNATNFGWPAGDDGKPMYDVLVAELHVILQEPRTQAHTEPVSDAVSRMSAMAKGEHHE